MREILLHKSLKLGRWQPTTSPLLNEGPASDSEAIFDNSEIYGLNSSIYLILIYSRLHLI